MFYSSNGNFITKNKIIEGMEDIPSKCGDRKWSEYIPLDPPMSTVVGGFVEALAPLKCDDNSVITGLNCKYKFGEWESRKMKCQVECCPGYQFKKGAAPTYRQPTVKGCPIPQFNSMKLSLT